MLNQHRNNNFVQELDFTVTKNRKITKTYFANCKHIATLTIKSQDKIRNSSQLKANTIMIILT